jgi:hypothetical protein
MWSRAVGDVSDYTASIIKVEEYKQMAMSGTCLFAG